MTPIERGRRAEESKDRYLNELFNRLEEQVKQDFMTCNDTEELKTLWDRKEALQYIRNQVKVDIERGKAALKEINK